MLQAALFLACVALAARAWQTRREPDRAEVRRRLVRFAAATVATRVLLELVELPALRSRAVPLAALAALAGLAMWAQLAPLAAVRPRRRDLWFRAPFVAVALIVALVRWPWSTVAFFTLLAVLAWRWSPVLSSGELFLAALGGVTLTLLSLRRWVPSPAPILLGAKGPLRDLLHFAKWANFTAVGYAVLGISPVLRQFVRDPSLGIRTVRRRVALSHLLVVAVPLAITIGMWVLTTWLGVRSDRAIAGKHALEAEGRSLRSALVQAFAAGGDPRRALESVASARRAAWPAMRIYRVSGGRLERIAGDSLVAEARLPGWTARLDSLAASGVVDLEGWRYLGAAARDSASGDAALALVPVASALRGEPARIADASLWIADYQSPAAADTAIEAAAESLATLARADSAVQGVGNAYEIGQRIGRRAAATRRPGGGPIIRTSFDPEGGVRDSGTITVDGRSAGGAQTGQSLVNGVDSHAGWRNAQFTLRANVGFASTMAGLFRNARENPFNFVPIALLVGLMLLLLPVAGFNFTLVRTLGRSVVEPVTALRDATTALGAGRLDYRIPLAGDDELWDTARAFNVMAQGLERGRELQKERDRMEGELELARRIQARLLPAGPPEAPGLEVAGRSEAAREVGGDYYDHLPLPDGRVLLVIADVSGKGVGAALLMSAFRAALMSQDPGLDPAELARRLNDFLHRSVDPGKFVTAFVGLLDGHDGRLVYANAGHNPPVVLRGDGRDEWLAAGGLILGIMAGSTFESGEVVLAPGDLVVLYTDGVTEGADATAEQFGEDRMVAALRRRFSEPAGVMAAELVREVRRFEGDSGPADDITVLVARRTGPA